MKKLRGLILFLLSFIVVDLVNILFSRHLNQFGLRPRSIDDLIGIPFSVWLHADLQHMFANLTALVVLSAICWQWGNKVFWKSTAFIIVLSGILVWLFARPALHIGASGLVYGYLGFCLFGGWFSKRLYLALLSILVAFFYGSMIWGVLPIQQGVSFEYHLAGLLSGLLAARLFIKTKQL